WVALVTAPAQVRVRTRTSSVDVMGITGVVLITVLSAIHSPLADLVPLLWTWLIITTFALWSTGNGIAWGRRFPAGLVQIAVCALAYGLVLLVSFRHDPLSAERWFVVVAMLI